MPTTRLGRQALVWCVLFVVMWLSTYALEAWARMPLSTLSTKLTVMIAHAYVTIVVGVFGGIMAGVAWFRYGDTSRLLWLPIAVAGMLVVAVVRSLLFP